MVFELNLANFFVGVGTIVGCVGVAAGAVMKMPMMNKNKQEECSDNDCHTMVIETSTKVEMLEKGQAKIFEKIDKIAPDVIRLLRDTKDLI